jgi:uncharacterized protein YbaR (Trm112 family)
MLLPFGLKRKENLEIMLCPKCRQPSLKQASNISGWMTQPMYHCQNKQCGYQGSLYVTIDPADLNKINAEDRDHTEYKEK